MRKILIALLLLLFAMPAHADMNGYIAGSGGVAVDYCTTQTWATLTSFKLDFDHTSDTKTACLASGTQVGVDAASTTIANPSPTTTGIGSGGNALSPDTAGDYIHFDNTSSILKTQYGEMYIKFKYDNNGGATYYIFTINPASSTERFYLYVDLSGNVTTLWEDNNHGQLTLTAIDADGYYGDWVQVHIKWDTTRCTDGTCDGVGEDELCIRARVDANNDGDFGDGGAEDWAAWVCETSATDLAAWATEPTTDSLQFGLILGTYDVGIHIDDVEISNAQPSW